MNFLSPLLVLLAIEIQAQPQISSSNWGNSIENQVLYTFIHYRETNRNVRLQITYPSGKVNDISRSFKRAEGHRIGNYSWLMGYMQVLIDEGYRIKSHGMEVLDSESHVVDHLFVLEQHMPR